MASGIAGRKTACDWQFLHTTHWRKTQTSFGAAAPVRPARGLLTRCLRSCGEAPGLPDRARMIASAPRRRVAGEPTAAAGPRGGITQSTGTGSATRHAGYRAWVRSMSNLPDPSRHVPESPLRRNDPLSVSRRLLDNTVTIGALKNLRRFSTLPSGNASWVSTLINSYLRPRPILRYAAKIRGRSCSRWLAKPRPTVPGFRLDLEASDRGSRKRSADGLED